MDKKQFDKEVLKYNKYLESLKNFKRKIKATFNIFGQKIYHPLYSRDDLTAEEKDSIALASDWQRVRKTLDKFLK